MDCSDFVDVRIDMNTGLLFQPSTKKGPSLKRPTSCRVSELNSERTSKLVEALSDFLRESSNFQNVEALVPQENELRLVQVYLYIQ